MPPKLERLFFIGDVHSPFHHKPSWKLVMGALADFNPTIVVSMGDFVDFFSVSHWSKNPERALSLRDELEIAGGLLDEVEARSEGARRIYIGGNHEDRLQRYLQDKAPELFSLIDVPKLLKLGERGWEWVAYKQSTQIGKLHLTHDVGSAGRYNCFKALDTFQSPVAVGHTHRLAYVVEGDATGDTHVSAQFGWLGDVEQVDYLHRVKARKDWALGFGYGYIDTATGYSYLVPVPIVDGTAIVEGRLYGGRRERTRRRAGKTTAR